MASNRGCTADDVPLFCVGCGDVERVKNSCFRRNITTASSRHIFLLWKSVMTEEIERSGKFQGDVNQLFLRAKVMCKTCFYAYEKQVKALEVSFIKSLYLIFACV